MSRSFPLPTVPELEKQQGSTISSLVGLMRRLLAPDGCPWDREQTPESLKRYVVEEAAEVLDAIDDADDVSMCEELGDLLLQVVFLTELMRARQAFGMDDVVHGICEKLVRRHPHVFADSDADDAEAVTAQWEAIKRQEKASRPLLGGVPRNLPALSRAFALSRKAAEVGFDWPDAEAALAKVREEQAELAEAVAASESTKSHSGAERPSAHVVEEFGDLLFAMTNWARHVGIEPESALARAADKFQRRFAHVEERVLQGYGRWPLDERGKPMRGVPLTELDRYWEEAKRAEVEA